MYCYLHVTDEKTESQRSRGLAHPIWLKSGKAWTRAQVSCFHRETDTLCSPCPFNPELTQRCGPIPPAQVLPWVSGLFEKSARKVSIMKQKQKQKNTSGSGSHSWHEHQKGSRDPTQTIAGEASAPPKQPAYSKLENITPRGQGGRRVRDKIPDPANPGTHVSS